MPVRESQHPIGKAILMPEQGARIVGDDRGRSPAIATPARPGDICCTGTRYPVQSWVTCAVFRELRRDQGLRGVSIVQWLQSVPYPTQTAYDPNHRIR